MTPFEAYILIQQGSPSKTTLEEALKSRRLNPNGTFKRDSFLSTAIKRNSPHILQLLLEYGAWPDLKSYENGRYEPAIITAIRHKSMSCVQILVEYGANVHKTNFYGADAIFQAVYENAFNILEYLLMEVCIHYRLRCRNTTDVLKETGKSIVIQKVTKEEGGAGTGAVVLNIKESSHYIENDYDHLFCPLYYALNKAPAYPGKEKSLGRLLQSLYECKCVRLVASCCHRDDEEEVKEEEKVAILECLGALDSFLEGVFYEKSREPEADASSIDRDLEKQQQRDHYNKPNAIFPRVDDDDDDDDDYGNNMKLGRRKLCAYRILRIEEKCHAIKVNEVSSSSTGASYLVLVGPLTLSSMAREVIRNQIMPLCTCTTSSRSIASSSSSLPPAVYNHYKNFAVKCEKRNFRKCLGTLNLPPSLLDYMVYGNTMRSVESGRSHIKLIKKDLMLNVNYFAFYIF